MKAIQINTEVSLNNGLSISSGAILVPSEGLIQIFAQKNNLIPAQIVSAVYSSKENYEAGKVSIDGNSIADFNPAMYNLSLTVSDYETQTVENLLLNTVYNELNQVYPNQCEIIDVTTPVLE